MAQYHISMSAWCRANGAGRRGLHGVQEEVGQRALPPVRQLVIWTCIHTAHAHVYLRDVSTCPTSRLRHESCGSKACPDVCLVWSHSGAHALALVGRKLFVFGGYGGDGYARRDFNDLYALDLDVWEWEMIDVPGEVRRIIHFHGDGGYEGMGRRRRRCTTSYCLMKAEGSVKGLMKHLSVLVLFVLFKSCPRRGRGTRWWRSATSCTCAAGGTPCASSTTSGPSTRTTGCGTRSRAPAAISGVRLSENLNTRPREHKCYHRDSCGKRTSRLQ